MAERRGKKRRYTYHAGSGYRKPKRRGPKPWVVITLVITAVALCGLLAWALLRGPAEEEPITTTVETLPSLQPDSRPESWPEPEPEPEPDPEPEPEEPADPKELHFTAEEIALLDDMLTEWAETVTAPVGEDAEAESEAGEGEGTENEESPDESTPKVVFTPETYGHNVSVYFKDLGSGLVYAFNVEQSYEIASLSKAPYVMYLYTLAEQGLLNLEDTVYVTAELLAASAENSGRLKDDETLPRDMTIEELIYEALRYSDTGALRILMSRYPADGYNAWATATLPLYHPENVKSVTNGRITADDAAVYMQAIYEFMETAEYGPRLKEHLTNTRNLLIKSNYTVARKYGWDTYSLHDMAVVYAEHPYVIAILTDKSYGTWNEQAMFATITAAIEEIVTAKYAAAG